MASARRSTRQRVVIDEALRAAGGFRTAQELHDEMKRRGERVGLTTIYRELQNRAGTGELDVLRKSDGEAVYRLCGTEDHHHHVVCRACGTSVEVSGDEVEAWAERVSRRHGFTNVTHSAEVYGECPACAPPRCR